MLITSTMSVASLMVVVVPIYGGRSLDGGGLAIWRIVCQSRDAGDVDGDVYNGKTGTFVAVTMLAMAMVLMGGNGDGADGVTILICGSQGAVYDDAAAIVAWVVQTTIGWVTTMVLTW